jgi:hypothetical protein
MNRILRLTLPAIALVAVSHAAFAQTSQKISVQGSGLFAQLYGDAFTDIKDGIGGELQLRYTPGKWSFGAGIQHTIHDYSNTLSIPVEGNDIPIFSNVKLTGVFVEPRYVIDIGSAKFAPYLSGRFAFSKMKFEFTDELLTALTGFILDLSEPTGPTINGGGGVLIRLASRANLDLGVTFGYTKFKDIRFRILDADSNVELTNDPIEIGSGTNAVFRVGLAFGLGG